MREFKKYNSIENSFREEFITKIKMKYPEECKNGIWAITEKVHGTNVQFGYDGTEYTFGKRTGYFEDGEKFYNLEKHAEHLRGAVKAVYETTVALKPDCKGVICFGELFGGSYPHKDVEKDKTAQRIQKGVFYCPHNDVFFFDVYVLTEDAGYYLNVKDFESVMYTVQNKGYMELLYQKSKLIEGLNKALEYPNDEPSEMYKIWGLPQLEDNIREGVVIKPYDKDLWLGQSRVIIKNKSEKFSEKVHAKIDKQPIEIPEEVVKCREEILQYINENRVNNVISHIGEVTEADIGKVIGLTSKDVLEDYLKDYKLPKDKENSKMVTKYLQTEVAKVVRKVILC